MSLAVLTRVEVCKLDDLPVGLGRAFTVGDKPIAVFRTRAGRVFAVDGLANQSLGIAMPALIADWGTQRAAFAPVTAANLAGVAIVCGIWLVAGLVLTRVTFRWIRKDG